MLSRYEWPEPADKSQQKQQKLAEERKVNLFYLKDTIMSRDVPIHDKLDAMA